MTITHRMMPPGDVPAANPITVNGRTYSCAVGSTIDVPDYDANIMTANHWVFAAPGGAGTTASRPATPNRGTQFHDTTLGYNVTFDGKAWRNPTSGAAV